MGRGVTSSPSGERCEAVYENDLMVGGGLFVYRLAAQPKQPPSAPKPAPLGHATRDVDDSSAGASLSAGGLSLDPEGAACPVGAAGASWVGPSRPPTASAAASGGAEALTGPTGLAPAAGAGLRDGVAGADMVGDGDASRDASGGEELREGSAARACRAAAATGSRARALPATEAILVQARALLARSAQAKEQRTLQLIQGVRGCAAPSLASGSGVAAAKSLSPCKKKTPSSAELPLPLRGRFGQIGAGNVRESHTHPRLARPPFLTHAPLRKSTWTGSAGAGEHHGCGAVSSPPAPRQLAACRGGAEPFGGRRSAPRAELRRGRRARGSDRSGVRWRLPLSLLHPPPCS